MNWAKIIIPSLVTALIAAFAILIVGASREEEAFMRECLQERKQYECTALWRGHSSQVMPIIIPMR